MTSPRRRHALLVLVATAMLCIALVLAAPALAGKPGPTPPPTPTGQWVWGDTHNHSTLSDGDIPLETMLLTGVNTWGCTWVTTTDHGGKSIYDQWGNSINPTPRWITLMANSWPVVSDLRQRYPNKVFMLGFEWGIPGIDEAKVAINSGDPTAISNFEYMFDFQDNDNSRADLPKVSKTYDDGVTGISWLASNYPTTSYAIPSHPSRDLLWHAVDFRRYNDAAPTVFFGMAGIPGSQKELPARGGYDTKWNTAGETILGRTYGGADYNIAKLGGVWDSLLGEGRKFWTYSDSDFHNPEEEFYPGEYSRDLMWVTEKSTQGIVNGLRSGNSVSVEGQLIDALDYKAAAGTKSATMGGTLNVAKGATVTVTVKWHSPALNNHGDVPKVNHVDLISGNVTSKLTPSDIGYITQTTNPSTKVAARFTTAKMSASGGWYSATYSIKATVDGYYRLRGTNQGLSVQNQTDANGNPLTDDLEGENDSVKCWNDIWFYSNPIFIDVQ